MRKLIVILFSLICIVAYSQKRNEYGLKLVKKMSVCDEVHKSTSVFELSYDNDNNLIRVYYYQPYNSKLYSIENCIKKGNRLIYTNESEVYYDYKKIEITLNNKGFLSKRVDKYSEKGCKYIDEYIYDENYDLIETVHTELDPDGNYFITPWGGPLVPLRTPVSSSKTEPKNDNVEYKRLNDTNVDFKKYNHFHLETFWIPNKYKRWVLVNSKVDKWEYIYDENNNITKVLKYNKNFGLVEKIEIEYLY